MTTAETMLSSHIPEGSYIDASELEEQFEDSVEELGSEIQPHPLANSWTFWYHNGKVSTEQDYISAMAKIFTFSTVEDFWSLHNHVIKPSSLNAGCTYFTNKEGINPEWEDPYFREGGELTVSFSRKMTRKADEWWLQLVLSVIGEDYDDDISSRIGGICIAVRKSQVRLSLWLNTVDQGIVTKLGKIFRNWLGLDSKYIVEFKSFKEQIKGNKAALYTL